MAGKLSEDFLGLPLDGIRAAALGHAQILGATNAEVRVERIRSQMVVVRDGAVEAMADEETLGVGLRVVHDGAVGFAATVDLSVDSAADLAERAVDLARATARASTVRVELAAEPGHGEVRWVSAYDVDPTTVPNADKASRLVDWSKRLLADHRVDHVVAHCLAVTEDKYLADLAGTQTTQRRVRVHPVVEAMAVDTAGGGFESMRTLAPPAGRGWEYLYGDGCDIDGEIDEIPELLAAKIQAPTVDPGVYDLIIDPSNLWLTIHESVGHATELDRALGDEAAYAGTSFATFDQLGHLRYGSDLMHVTGDRTVPYGLATVGFDDEGVSAQEFDIVRDGVLVGYQLDRRVAVAKGLGRSNGCAFADSPLHVPIQRMANVSLRPAADSVTTEDLIAGIDRGIYVVGDKSWSIDMQRHNFQFTGQRFYLVEKGRLVGQVRDVAYQSSTTDFWGSLDGLGGPGTWVLGGAFNCGKGQPGQVAPVSHGCPSARFRQVNVLNTRGESGR